MTYPLPYNNNNNRKYSTFGIVNNVNTIILFCALSVYSVRKICINDIHNRPSEAVCLYTLRTNTHYVTLYTSRIMCTHTNTTSVLSFISAKTEGKKKGHANSTKHSDGVLTPTIAPAAVDDNISLSLLHL